jgi:hypothetical protein
VRKMAMVKNLEKTIMNARVHAEVKADYNVLIKDGEKYFQINTYGSENRVIKKKVSQALQFNEESAKQLFEILKKEFGF